MMLNRYAVLFVMILVCLSCTPQGAKKTVDSSEGDQEKILATDAGKELTVKVAAENVRALPNGRKLGRLSRGSALTVIKKVGNWIQFSSKKFPKAYIWAPSVGYTYENLYSPFFYFDSTRSRFQPVEYFQTFFSQQGQRREETSSNYELFFKDIGLGSHAETVMEVTTATEQVVEHGITLYINKSSGKIERIRVDYFRPVKGVQAALKKSELTFRKPSTQDNVNLVWEAGTMVKDLVVDLERKDWDSKWFSSIWYKTPENN